MVKNLPSGVDKKQFDGLFSEFGVMESKKYDLNKSGETGGIGWATFDKYEIALAVVKMLNGTKLYGQTLKVSILEEEEEEPASADSTSTSSNDKTRSNSGNSSHVSDNAAEHTNSEEKMKETAAHTFGNLHLKNLNVFEYKPNRIASNEARQESRL